jgi:hypothetical protein
LPLTAVGEALLEVGYPCDVDRRAFGGLGEVPSGL